MARTRKTSREALDEKIEKAEADVIVAKKKYDHATAVLKELLDKRDAIRKDEILSAIVKSGRSYEEINCLIDHLRMECLEITMYAKWQHARQEV